MLSRSLRLVLALGLGLGATAAPAAAQELLPTPPTIGGWMFTPALYTGTSWDDNVLIRGRGDDMRADLYSVINPRGTVDFRGRRTEFTGVYEGAFLLYRDFSSLNSYDQHASAAFRRLVSRHVAVTARHQLSTAPTTELADLVGVPYVRTGSEMQYLRAGVEASLSKHTTLTATYNFQIVDFGESPFLSPTLLGGHSHGAFVSVRRAVSPRVAVTADYDLQHSRVGDAGGFSDIHRAEGGVELRPAPHTRVFAAGGVSRLDVGVPPISRSGPSWRAGISQQLELATIEGSYSRSFVPSYGFGGTQQNEELTGRIYVPVNRSVYTRASLSWRINEPLADDSLKLKTLSLHASVGRQLSQWAAIEGFYDSAAQRVPIPGGFVDRHRLGVQFITTKPMRIR